MKTYHLEYSLIDLIHLHRIGELSRADEEYLAQACRSFEINPDTIEV
jgi:hypothetical protein